MQFCVKSSSDPAQQHPETKYYSPAVLPKSPLAFFFTGPQQVLAAAPPCKAAEVMVEGETLLLLLLCAPCQRTALQGSPSNG